MRRTLDTNIVIAALKGVGSVRARLETTPTATVWLSPIVLGELRLGVEKSQNRERNSANLALVAGGFDVAALDAAVCQEYVVIRADLERRGCPIGANDTWIAAHARALGSILVTDNVGEFSRVPGLRLENWLR